MAGLFSRSKILVTGGAGYIGSHTVLELLQKGYEVVILDNLSNSRVEVVDALRSITGKLPEFVAGDIRDTSLLDRLFSQHKFNSVLHFAGLKSVEESVREPLSYYDNNVGGTLALLSAMQKHGVKKLVFSSSATVYGDPTTVPIPETATVAPVNPYGHNKAMVEQILHDLSYSDKTWSVAVLRYFNPVGAHTSGMIGENPVGIPNNLMPYIAQVAKGLRDSLSVYGNDYPTADGTGVRDYIHVTDLALGHLSALDKIQNSTNVHVYNLGTGKGHSVMEVLQTFKRVTGMSIPFQYAPRRVGDAACSYADPSKARLELGWAAEKTLDDMCADTWRWQQKSI